MMNDHDEKERNKKEWINMVSNRKDKAIKQEYYKRLRKGIKVIIVEIRKNIFLLIL